MPPYLGIDFGTSNCVLAHFHYGQAEVIPNREGQLWTPSVVTLRREGTLAFGQEARENFEESRSIRSVKRLLGSRERVLLLGQSLWPEQIAVLLFNRLKQDAEAYLKESVTKVVVTIPANSKGLARHATKLCAGAAGFQVLTLINEPTAAAICYGLNAQQEQTVLVYDFGGGTLDVTILRIHHGIFEEISSKGISKLGGEDLDRALAQLIAERFRQKTGYDLLHSPYQQQLLLAVEQAKIELSSQEVTVVRRPAIVPERHLSLEEELDRATLEKVIYPFVEQSGAAIDEALKRRGLRPRDIDRVLLVGGTSKIPLVRRFVADKLGGKEPEPFSRADPMTCVAQGAAIVSALLQQAPGLDNYAYSVKLEHSLCTNPVNEHHQVYLDPIIRRGADIPCSYTKVYHPVADPAERVLISVYEGDDYNNPDSPENVKLAEIPWEFHPPRPQRDAALEVTYEYGDDGILTVQIHDVFTGQKKRFAIQQASAEVVDTRAITRLVATREETPRSQPLWESSLEYREALEILRKTEQDVLPRVDSPQERQELEELCRQVREALQGGSLQALERATTALNDRLLNYAYLL